LGSVGTTMRLSGKAPACQIGAARASPPPRPRRATSTSTRMPVAGCVDIDPDAGRVYVTTKWSPNLVAFDIKTGQVLRYDGRPGPGTSAAGSRPNPEAGSRV